MNSVTRANVQIVQSGWHTDGQAHVPGGIRGAHPAHRRGRKQSRRQRAQALVELALVMPVLTMLALAGVDFSRAYLAGVTFVHAAQQGARYVSTLDGTNYAAEATTPQELVLLAIADADANQGGAGGFVNAKSLTSGGNLSTSDVTITLTDTAGSVAATTTPQSGYSVQVKVTGIVPFFTGFLANGVDGFAPGLNLCTGSVCGIPITGEAVMVVM